ncbi:MAG: ATP-binding protein [Bacteroidales bacterium]|nr:ATP-binding protein [Bacteroidales bacterium]
MRKSFLFIALIFFLLVSFIGLDLLFKQMNKEQVLTDRLLTKLKQNEYNLLNGKDRIVSWNEIQNTELCFDCLNQRIGELDELELFIYQDSSLLYWSTNLSQPKLIRITFNGEHKLGFARLSDGIYQYLTFPVLTQDSTSRWFVLLVPVYKEYSIHNQFLQPHVAGNIFADNVSISLFLQEEISTNFSVENLVYRIDKLFAISTTQAIILFVLFLCIYLLLFNYLFSSKLLRKITHRTGLQFVIAVLLLYIGFWFFQFVLSVSSLAESSIYSLKNLNIYSSEISLGEAVFWIIQLLLFSWVLKNYFPLRLTKSPFLLRLIILVTFYIFVFYAFYFLVSQLIFQSKIPLSFHEFYELNIQSYLLLLMISILAMLVFSVLMNLVSYSIFQYERYWIAILLVMIFLAGKQILVPENGNMSLIADGFALLFFIVLLVNRQFEFEDRNNFRLVVFVLLSIILTWLFYAENLRKSKNEQELVAMQLNVESDPMFEFVFNSVFKKISNDTIVKELIYRHDFEELEADSVYQYILNHYTHDYFSKYNISVTLCDDWDELLIQPGDYVTNCNTYFSELIEQSGFVSDQNPHLYYIKDNLIGAYYLARVPIFHNQYGQVYHIFLEFYFKYFPEGLGYPELLVEKNNSLASLFSSYSFATYSNGKLAYKFGKYLYPLEMEQLSVKHSSFTSDHGFRHYFLEMANGSGLVVSKSEKRLIDIIAPFSYFIIVLSLLSLFHNRNLLQHPLFYFRTLNFRSKLQIFNLSALIFSFLIIGFISSYYIRDIYQQKSDDFLSERTQSILIELEHKLQQEDINAAHLSDYLHQILSKFSQVFFSDINLYNLDGDLLASSRPEIFQRKLISEKMNPDAFAALESGKSFLFLHQEQIGSGSYYSSYVSFQDASGETAAFVNLPYFARESELRTEISTFVLTYMNIFILLSGISAFVVLYLSGRLTKPLLLLQSKMKAIRFDQKNEPIEWKSRDEIGQLVNQYNQLIVELEKSVELLARSERETAWREMARQVAHEIKNPLTPMRLSVQHLKRSWDDNDPEIEQKIERTTKTLIEQIDTLSSIATAFSDFARMPVNKPEPFDLTDLIKRTALLYSGKSNVDIDIQTKEGSVFVINADKKNIGRAFGNLFKNAVQAIGTKVDGKISIEISAHESDVKVIVQDNGKGMTTEEQNKLFTPNFTTKSSGMGLGLSIVNQIVVSAGGRISFESHIGRGTSFTMFFPLWYAPNHNA